MTNSTTTPAQLTHLDPPCKRCGRPADAHAQSHRCPEQAAGCLATYDPR